MTTDAATLDDSAPGIGPVTFARDRLQSRRDGVEEAEEELILAVRVALVLGVRAVDVAEVLGVTRARVYQIRDGRR